MNRTRLANLLVVSVVLIAVSGCGCCRNWCGWGRCGTSYAAPVVAASPPCNGTQPAYAVPPVNHGPSYYQPPAYQSPVFQPPVRKEQIHTAPLPEPPSSSWKPSERLPVVTEIPGPTESKKPARLMPPEEQKQPPSDLPPPEQPEFSADIPRFAVVYDNVHAGEQPLANGFNWLKSHNYRTVLYLRSAGEDDSAARAEVEAKGLRYVSLEVGPRTLNRELVAEFGRIIADTKGHPLFVYDKKGMPAGAMWYLHFRLNENADDANARGRAIRLGLKTDDSGDHADLWLAINKLLSNQ